jgi:hypothetical protein
MLRIRILRLGPGFEFENYVASVSTLVTIGVYIDCELNIAHFSFYGKGLGHFCETNSFWKIYMGQDSDQNCLTSWKIVRIRKPWRNSIEMYFTSAVDKMCKWDLCVEKKFSEIL